MYQVPAQRELMLDPHCLYSPIAGSSLAIIAFHLFFSSVCFPSFASEFRRFFFFLANIVLLLLFIFELLPFFFHVQGTGPK